MRTRANKSRTVPGVLLGLLLPLALGGVAHADPCTKVEPYLNKSEHRLAEGAARTCLEKFPNHVRVWYLLSRALAGQKRYTDALKWVDKSIEKYPGDKDLHIWRVRLLAWSGDLDKAWSERFRIIKAAQHRRDAAMLIADVAFWRKDCVEAVKWYDFIAKKWPNAERAKANRDRCMSDAGDKTPEPVTTKSQTPKQDETTKPATAKAPTAATKTYEQPTREAQGSGSMYTPGAAPGTGTSRVTGTTAKAAPTCSVCPKAKATAKKNPTRKKRARRWSGRGYSRRSSLPVTRNSCRNLHAHYRLKDYRGAERQARECIKVGRAGDQAWEILFSSQLAQGLYDSALGEATRQMRAHPQSEFFRYWRVKILARQGRTLKAWYEAAALSNYEQRSYDAAELVASLAYRLGKYHTAAEKFEAFLRRWPNNLWPRLYLAKSWGHIGRYSEAVAELKYLCRKHEFTRACQELTWMRRTSPSTAIATSVPAGQGWRGKGRRSRSRPGRVDPSTEMTISPVSLDPATLPVFDRARMSRRKAARDERRARRQLRRNPDNRSAMARLMRTMEARGLDQEGLNLASGDSSALHPRTRAVMTLWTMRFLAHLGHYDEAWKLRGQVRDILRATPRVNRTVADLAFVRRDYAEAARLYAFQTMIWRRNADVLYLRALAQGMVGNSRRSLADLRRACRVGGRRHVSCLHRHSVVQRGSTDLARRYAQKGKYDQALEAINHLIRANPRDIGARLWRIRFLAWRGSVDQASREVLQLKRLFGRDQEVTRLVADLAYWSKDYASAVERYTFYDVLWPDDPQVLLNRGRSYVELGERTSAMNDLARACGAGGVGKSACGQVGQLRGGAALATAHAQPVMPARSRRAAPYGRMAVAPGAGSRVTVASYHASASASGVTDDDLERHLRGDATVIGAQNPSRYPGTLECQDHALLSKKGRDVEAEALLRHCLQQPQYRSDLSYWIAMSRALANQKKYASALAWAKKAVEQAPTNRAYALWQARLKAWSNDLEGAWNEAKALYLVQPTDKEGALLVADVAFWRKDYAMAARLYSRYLSSYPAENKARLNRGRAYLQLGEIESGERDLTIVCSEEGSGSAACGEMDSREFNARYYTLMFQAGYYPVHYEPFINMGDTWHLMGMFSVNFGRKLQLGTSALFLAREFSALDAATGQYPDRYDYKYDVMLDVFAQYRWQSGFSLFGSVGFTPAPDFLPLVSIKLEPAYEFDFGLRPSFLIWRLQWETGSGTTVLSPGVSYATNRWYFLTRLYVGIDDDVTQPSDVGATFLAKVTFNPIPLLGFVLGAAVGNKPEYIDSTARSSLVAKDDFFWSLMAGVHFFIKGQHSIMVDYVFRDERYELKSTLNSQNQPPFFFSTPEQYGHFRQHQILLGYRILF